MEKGSRGGAASRNDRDQTDLLRFVVSVRRVATVRRGGKKFSFTALVVVGNGQGKAGYGSGKAREVSEAVRKAADNASKAMTSFSLKKGRTVYHDVTSSFGAGLVCVRTAPPGTGVIAGGPMRAVFEAIGIQDVVSKSLKSSNPHNMVKATFRALLSTVSPRSIAEKRGKRVAEIFGIGGSNRTEGGDNA